MAEATRRSIIDLSCVEVRAFLLKHESYCNTELPKYFQFGELLDSVDCVLGKKTLCCFWNGRGKLRELEGVNYRILNNKDGRYEWRPYVIG